MAEYVRGMKFTLEVDTNKQTYTFKGDDWDGLRRAWTELTENDFAPSLANAPPSGSVPEVTAADVAYLQGLLAESERTQGARVLDRTMYAIERACLSRILAAVSALQGRTK